jgi:hypothetical protein
MASFFIHGGTRFTGVHLEGYRTAVRTVIANVRRSSTGRALLAANGAAASDRVVFIEPQPPGYDFFAHVRAVRAPVVDSSAFQSMRVAAQAGRVPAPPAQAQAAASTIYFTPGAWHHGGILDQRAVFLHELLHAYRMVAHLDRFGTPTPHTAYPNTEEFYAVVAANVLRSELGLPLRKGYASGSQGVDPVFGELYRRIRGFGGDVLASHTDSFPRQPTADELRWLSCRFATDYRDALQPAMNDPFYTAVSALSGIPFNPLCDLRHPRVAC